MGYWTFLPLVVAFAVVSIPLLGQLLPLHWRQTTTNRRTRAYCNAAFQCMAGVFFCLSKGTEAMGGKGSLDSLVIIAMGGVMVGSGISQALAVTRPSLLLGEGWNE